MNKEIEAFDLAIAKLQKEKEKAIQNSIKAKKNKQEKIKKNITPKDKLLIQELNKLAEWWRKEGPQLEKDITITIKANLIWTEDKSPKIDGYNILYNSRPIDFDEEIHNNNKLFKKDFEKYQKQIDHICNQSDKLEKKYPGVDLGIFN